MTENSEARPITDADVSDLRWLVDMAGKAAPGWWKKGDGKRLNRLQDLLKDLTGGLYEPVPTRFDRRDHEGGKS